jgi:uncharacterized protein (TIGR02246 family)
MRMMPIAAVAGVLAGLSACAPQSSQSFDPNDPAVIAVIDSLMNNAVQASREVDAVKVLESMGTGENFTLVTGDVLLRGSEAVSSSFVDTYEGLLRQNSTIDETHTRLLTPDVAVFSAVGEGTYTDLAGWTSEPVGLGLTIIFVLEDGRWVGRVVHQSIAP